MSNTILEEMKEQRYSQRMAAKKISMSLGTFNSRVHGKTEWKTSEMIGMCDLLNITPEKFIKLCR